MVLYVKSSNFSSSVPQRENRRTIYIHNNKFKLIMIYTCNRLTTKAGPTANIISKTIKSKRKLSCEQKFTICRFPTKTRLFHIHVCTLRFSKESLNNVWYLHVGTIVCYKCEGTQTQRSIIFSLFLKITGPFISTTTILNSLSYIHEKDWQLKQLWLQITFPKL